MRTLLLILTLISLQASGQALFHAHNKVSAPAGPVYSPPPVLPDHDFDAIIGINYGGGSYVQSIEDQVGNNDAYTSNPMNSQITFIENAIGGFPAISFASGLGLSLTTPIDGAITGLTVFVVGEKTYNAEVILHENVSEYLAFFDANLSYSGSVSYAATLVNGTFYTASVYTNGSTRAVGVNGSYGSEGGGSVRFSFIGGYGYSNSYKGKITRLIIYKRALTSSEINSVNTYLKNRYNHY